ncbi:DUF3124 domain-containing protein [Bythopirellula polymerisocia]|uniref:DUF3124 domain-containing protein n=1 Tax=Bythopirellula polymerisocia TaxID=2528003 RepID=A0A5C6CWK1_9BACT|nr:DUF3124 domain-containing protein [Bythopirellula polymerisocia]TWU29353.1 hypothetical protein Pla144_01290 [Bythopirellula polymerisocia]
MAKIADSDVDAFMRRFWMILIFCFFLVLVPIFLGAYFLERRLDSFEETLRFQAPQAVGAPAADLNFEMLTSNAVQGQTVYVPAYSHIYHQDGKPHLLTITLSVRNTSLDHEIILTSVRYFDTEGKEIKQYLESPLSLAPLATTAFLVERDDTSGGSGANFLVEWISKEPVTQPVIEAVMIDTSAQQGISFARSGTVIKEKTLELDGSAVE